MSGDIDSSLETPSTQDAKLRIKKIVYLGIIATVVIVIVYAVAISLTNNSASTANSRSTQPTGVENGGPLVGRKAPDFSLPGVLPNSTPVTLSHYLGHPVVLNFFASWCVPCKTELPEFASLSKSDVGKVQFIGVDENDTIGPGSALIKATGVTYPTGFDGGAKLVQPYHIIGLPTTLFINSKGVVVEDIAGQISLSTLKQGVSRLVGK